MRPQLKKGSGGPLIIELRKAPDGGSAAITITRADGDDLPEPVAAVAVADSYRFEGDIAGQAGLDYITFTDATLPPTGMVVTLVSDSGQRQELHVRDASLVDGDVTLTFKSVLDFDISGGSIISHLVSYTVSAANCPEVRSNYFAVLTYESNGVVLEDELTFDVGLSYSYNPATYSDFSRVWATISTDVVSNIERTHLESALDNGYESVENVYGAAGRNVNRVRNRKALVPQIINRAMHWLGMAGIVPAAWADKIPEWLELLDAQFDGLYKTAPISWYDDDDDGEATAEEENRSRNTSIRLVK